MSRFSDAWLRSREHADTASRALGLVTTLKQILPQGPIQVIDLATGTGANLRYLCPRLGRTQWWCLIDHDRALLDAIPARLGEWARDGGAQLRSTDDDLVVIGADFECHVRRVRADLATGFDAIELPARSLISAAALLDLVSDLWLQSLARRCREARAAVLFALTYDGRMSFEPAEPEDTIVTDFVNRHQLSDKGFGPALGPAAGPSAAQVFELQGFRVVTAPSDWRIGPRDRSLQTALLDGWVAAAVEIAPALASVLGSWAERRRAHVAHGHSKLTVGHVDMLGWLPD